METENKIITDMQKKAFTEEYKTLRSKKQLNKESRLLALKPFIDEDRMHTRLKYVEYHPYAVMQINISPLLIAMNRKIKK